MTKKHPSRTTVIGIDIGGTGIKGGIVDLETGEVVGDRFRIPTPSPSTPQAVAKVVKEIVDELSGRKHAPSEDAPVGITFPAIISHGVSLSAANVDQSWINADVDDIFSKELGRDVQVMNDADAAGLAEARYGAGRGRRGAAGQFINSRTWALTWTAASTSTMGT